jgi:hypothetical protein
MEAFSCQDTPAMRTIAPPSPALIVSSARTFGAGGIMNATIELVIVSLCWLGVFGAVATIIAGTIG